MTNSKKIKPPKSKILYVKPKHIDDIYEIEKKCFPSEIGYSKQELTYLILHPDNICLVEILNEVIRAFLILNVRSGSLIGRIITIDVDPIFQNQGIGLRLLKKAEVDMRQKGIHWSQLEVSETNKTAFVLYAKAGYIFKEKIKDYYKSKIHGTCDAIRMIKALS
jgi:ribosomal protein S18 acetylase RimI-like enzyme